MSPGFREFLCCYIFRFELRKLPATKFVMQYLVGTAPIHACNYLKGQQGHALGIFYFIL